MKEFFSIGEISKLFDINKKTLRYYDEIGLFKPSFVNKDNNYRYYTLDQFQYLETIKYLKELGLSLDKIKYNLTNLNSEDVINSLEEQNNIIDTKISELQLIKQKINKKIIQIKDSTRNDLLETIREVDFNERQAVRLRHSIKTDYDIEFSLRKLIKMSDNKIFLTYGLVGVSISRDDLIDRKYDEYKSIFIMIEEEKYDKSLIKIFPKGTYVCIRFKGVHKDAPPYYEKLINYINKQGYEIIDDSLEMELTDPSLSLTDEEVIMELQILVKKS
ncbi:MAG: MerR family transcriptional regulator [Clostridiales bacterium]|uniref:MerR family transcriptional regulator n=1 Tax=Terrisporobacter sp. TaxID=1965305 RepID=UPI002A521781|nr:MerR family transcriptional regulator [Terrisporobacter sp.]MDD7753947.1 MerR family transcriptional regulator [Clostridiales bacterium]MDY4134049.1 MerR family transcriptional regulator [Terrisporobacter sp.]